MHKNREISPHELRPEDISGKFFAMRFAGENGDNSRLELVPDEKIDTATLKNAVLGGKLYRPVLNDEGERIGDSWGRLLSRQPEAKVGAIAIGLGHANEELVESVLDNAVWPKSVGEFTILATMARFRETDMDLITELPIDILLDGSYAEWAAQSLEFVPQEVALY